MACHVQLALFCLMHCFLLTPHAWFWFMAFTFNSDFVQNAKIMWKVQIEIVLIRQKGTQEMARKVRRNLPKDAVWNVVMPSTTFLPPVMTVLPCPSPMNIRLVFFLPTFKLFSSYLKIPSYPKGLLSAHITPFIYCNHTSASNMIQWGKN